MPSPSPSSRLLLPVRGACLHDASDPQIWPCMLMSPLDGSLTTPRGLLVLGRDCRVAEAACDMERAVEASSRARRWMSERAEMSECGSAMASPPGRSMWEWRMGE